MTLADTTAPQLDVPDSGGIEGRLLAKVATLIEALDGRTRLINDLWARTPIYIQEHANASAASALSIGNRPTDNAQVATSGPELIEAVVVCVPSAATLTLAETVWFFNAAGVYTVAPIEMVLNPGEIRQLVAGSSGTISLTLLGHQLPQWGAGPVK